jgi:ABC-type uncharacterized transport system permease subunit
MIAQLLAIELKKNFSYRVDFWVNFIFSGLSRLTIAYFLWDAVFSATGKTQNGGMDFHQMMLYFLMACR